MRRRIAAFLRAIADRIAPALRESVIGDVRTDADVTRAVNALLVRAATYPRSAS